MDNTSPVTPQDQRRTIMIKLGLDIASITPWLIVAILSNSILLLTDMFDYGRSITASLISLHILRRIIKGNTVEYDYGPGKMEVLGGIFVSAAMLAGLIVMAKLSIERIIFPEMLDPKFATGGLFLCTAGFIANSWLWKRNEKIAHRSHAPLMEAEWRINRADALTNISAVAGLSFSVFFSNHGWSIYADPVFALAINIYAGVSIVKLIRFSLNDLLDKTLDEDLQMKILKRLAESDQEYDFLHGIRSRKSGGKSFIDLSIGFSPRKTVGEAMAAVSRLRKTIEADIPGSEVNVVLKPEQDRDAEKVESNTLRVVPLSSETIQSALELLQSYFEEQYAWTAVLELEESVSAGKHSRALADLGICSPRYWVTVHGKSVLAVTGIYYTPADCTEALWVGWTAGKNLDTIQSSAAFFMVLSAAAEAAVHTGKKIFRIETDERFSRANRLVEHAGLEIFKKEIKPDGSVTLFRQGEIASVYQKFKERFKNR